MSVYRIDAFTFQPQKMLNWIAENNKEDKVLRFQYRSRESGKTHVIAVFKNIGTAKIFSKKFKSEIKGSKVEVWKKNIPLNLREPWFYDSLDPFWMLSAGSIVITSAIGWAWVSIIIMVFVINSYLSRYFTDNYHARKKTFQDLFFLMLVIIFAFRGMYADFGIICPSYAQNCVDGHTKEFFDTLYFSMVTWTTLGYGDFQPHQDARLIASTQALIGYVYMGLFVGVIFQWFSIKDNEKPKRPDKVSPLMNREFFELKRKLRTRAIRENKNEE